VKEGDKPGCIAVVKNIGSVKDEGENVSWNRKASLKTRYVIIDNNPEGSSLGFLSCRSYAVNFYNRKIYIC